MKTATFFSALLAFLTCALGYAQTDFLDTSTWTEGTGSVTGFNRVGTDAENVRELGTDPFGNSSVLWKASPDVNNNNDGGWNTPYYDIDHTRTYRLTAWVRKTNSNGGITRFGFNSRDASNGQSNLRTDGTALNNPYFLNGDLPELDKWYLLVGFVHASDYTGTEILSGIYDPTTGQKVQDANTDFKFAPTAVRLRHRLFLTRTTNTEDFQFMYGPTLFEVNGSEPSIAALMPPPEPAGGDSPWTSNGPDIYYDAGNVAVGLNAVPSGYRLAVDGNVIAEEIRVELSGNWPDYVFENAYQLPQLEEIEQYIAEYGHLPKVPSAQKVEEEGLQLGEMNRLLLEKIEELTLYIIAQEKRLDRQQQEIDQLKSKRE